MLIFYISQGLQCPVRSAIEAAYGARFLRLHGLQRLHMAAEMTLINTMTNSKLSDIIFQIVIALLSDIQRRGRAGSRELSLALSVPRSLFEVGKWKLEMMKGTIGALISQRLHLRQVSSSSGGSSRRCQGPTCVYVFLLLQIIEI